jgi:hypothetical protein
VLDVLVQRQRNKQAAKRLLRKLLKKQMRPPRVMITDKLASYGAAKREAISGIEHRQHKGRNNQAENPHQPAPRGCRSGRVIGRGVGAFYDLDRAGDVDRRRHLVMVAGTPHALTASIGRYLCCSTGTGAMWSTMIASTPKFPRAGSARARI